MRITPIDITHKSFNKKFLGFSAEEVLEFLGQVAQNMEELIHERNSLREALREKELALLEYKEKDQLLKSTLATASQMSDKMRVDAEREAKLIIAEANQRVELMTRDGRDSLKKIYNDIADLKKTRMQFEAQLKAVAVAHLSLLEQGDKIMPNIVMPHLQSTPQNNPKTSEISPLSSL
jgi:cell division initiation protein